MEQKNVRKKVPPVVWDQDAASSSLATRTKSPESACTESGLFCLYGARLEQLNATRMSVAGDGWTEPNRYLRKAQMQTSLAAQAFTTLQNPNKPPHLDHKNRCFQSKSAVFNF